MKTPQADAGRGLGQCWWWPLVPVAWVCLFWRLGAQPLQSWDESRLAVSAAEMLRSHNWLVTTYRGAPDLWNTKPPLLIWLQALIFTTFGYSEWAFRLPTALAALALVALVAGFARRWLGGPVAGLVAGLALLTSKGFVTHHVARTGDYEALLLLWLTGQVLAAFCWLQTSQRRYLLLLGASIGLAVLTKGVAGLFFLPGIAIAVVQRKRLGSLLRQPAAWLSLGLALGPPAIWYALREHTAPGYLAAVWQNELGGRLTQGLEQQTAPWYSYLLHFFTQQFLLWTPWVVAAIVALARRPARRPSHRFLVLAAWAMGVFLLIISLAATKHTWYDAPVYPLLALVLGGGLALLARQVATGTARATRLKPLLLLALAVVPSAVAVVTRLNKTHTHRYDEPMLTHGRYLSLPAATPATRYTILHATNDPATTTYNSPLEFYALTRRIRFADTVAVVYDARELPPQGVVLVCGKAAQEAVTALYQTTILYQADSCITYRLQAARE